MSKRNKLASLRKHSHSQTQCDSVKSIHENAVFTTVKKLTPPIWKHQVNPQQCNFIIPELIIVVKSFTPTMWKQRDNPRKCKFFILELFTAVKNLTSLVWNHHTQSTKIQCSIELFLTCEKIHTYSVKVSDPICKKCKLSILESFTRM